MNKLTTFLALLASLLATPLGSASELSIKDAWIREAPPTARVLAGYLTLVNTGDSTITVTAISSPDFEGAEIHRTVIEDGVARMLPVNRLEIPASGQLTLEPGGLHLMLFDPRRPLAEGDSVTLTIHRSNGSNPTTTAPVVRKTGEDHSRHHH